MYRKKHVERWALEALPPLPDQQRYFVVKSHGTQGKNLHQVEFPDGHNGLCILPPRFRNVLWIKRGHYLIVDVCEKEGKIEGEIVFVLRPEHIKYLENEGCWPQAFNTSSTTTTTMTTTESVDMFVNTNRRVMTSDEETTTSEEEEEEEETQV
jgi:probable RNA-binding protein EIF1AD